MKELTGTELLELDDEGFVEQMESSSINIELSALQLMEANKRYKILKEGYGKYTPK